jgi:NhaA family Na+:H+ antiporter
VPGSLVGVGYDALRSPVHPNQGQPRDDNERTGAGARVVRPLAEFLHTEAAGGVVLVAAAVVALVWANSPWQGSYEELWTTHRHLSLGSHRLDLDVRHWINDALMAIFFFVVGLEIKRELVQGELRDARKAALPAIAAVGGMVVPAALFALINAGGAGARGWGIPMATDIAMAVGVLSLLGRRVHPSLKLFLLVLAIVDDIGAILVIAVFYSDSFDLRALALALMVLGVVAVVKSVGVRSIPVYVVFGVGLWLAVQQSGLHATLAGVILGLMAPTQPVRRADRFGAGTEEASVVERLERRLHPWTSFLIVPLFALANAGIPLGRDDLAAAVGSRITYGVVVGLVVGKVVGITAFTWLAARVRVGVLPAGATWPGIIAVAMIGGIGFTVSIFVAGLAYEPVALQDEAKVGILAASVLAALAGATLVRVTGRGPAPGCPSA